MADSKTVAKATNKPNAITKMEAVRQAFAKLGKSAMPVTVRDYVKEHFAVEMTAKHVSVCKGKIFHKKPAATKAAPKPATKPLATKPAVAKAPTQPSVANKTEPTTPAQQGNGIRLDDIERVKGLIERVGAGSLRTLIDLVAR